MDSVDQVRGPTDRRERAATAQPPARHGEGDAVGPADASRPREHDTGDPQRTRLVDYITSVGPPSAVAAALLFYFGWVRAHAQAEALGYDISVVGLSNADYLLRSVPALFLPLLALVVAGLLLLKTHPVLVRFLDRRRKTAIPTVTIKVLRLAPLWVPILGIVSIVAAPFGDYAALPFSLTIGLLAYIYGGRLARSLGKADEEPKSQHILAMLLLVMLLFWDVERVARSFGHGFAELIVSRPEQFASVVIYSRDDLEISQPGVLETRIGGEESAYRYQYDGLRLLNYSGEKYFLLTEQSGDGRPVVLVVPDLPTIRVEF
jgi:hypothetical protein